MKNPVRFATCTGLLVAVLMGCHSNDDEMVPGITLPQVATSTAQ